MSLNTTANVSFRSYPYVREFWQDPTGSHQWTVSTSKAAVISALLAMLVALVASRLVTIIYTLMRLFFLHKTTTTLIDDQANVVVANSNNPSTLFLSLLQLGFYTGRRSFSSRVIRILSLIALFFLAIQATLVFTISRLISNQPLPISLGTCGFPLASDFSDPRNFALYKSHDLAQFQQSAIQYLQCNDTGTTITCPGPADGTFSWTVVESEPDYCWFGPEHCYNGSRTIFQKATIVPSDMGTIRKSRMSLTVMAECSHVSNIGFTQRGYNPIIMTNFTAYQFGVDPGYANDPTFLNATVLAYDDEHAILSNYDVEFESFNVWENLYNWVPPLFLANSLNASYLNEEESGSSSLNLIFNRLTGISSKLENSDPFFLTRRINNTDLFTFGRQIATLACRDQFRLEVSPTNGKNDSFQAIGSFTDIANIFSAYRDGQPHQVAIDDLDTEFLLFSYSFNPSLLFLPLNRLAGLTLQAQTTVQQGIQYGLPEKISTRVEVTRWFGISILRALHSPELFTSKNENDWGFGIDRLADDAWVCDSTLRIAASYTAINIVGLSLIFGIGVLIILFSYLLQPLLWYILKKSGKPWSLSARDTLISQNLHSGLQLHRIAVEETSNQTFLGTLDVVPVVRGCDSKDPGRAPVYGVTKRSITSPTRSNIEDPGNSGSKSANIDDEQPYATILRDSRERKSTYDVRDVR